ncbi:unnamed protein product [marine sediment metagenome]|uniref:HTH marR-type domain-containing protein n=1 Tax=marine sediment metagenome TaxID=412755 RepID=X1AZ98_9ZZZZ
MLEKHGEQKVSELSLKMGLSDSTVSGILDRLEQKDIIQRERTKDDRRVVKISLTGKSKEFCNYFRNAIKFSFRHNCIFSFFIIVNFSFVFT